MSTSKLHDGTTPCFVDPEKSLDISNVSTYRGPPTTHESHRHIMAFGHDPRDITQPSNSSNMLKVPKNQLSAKEEHARVEQGGESKTLVTVTVMTVVV